jgi:hypothetical protein
VIEDRELFSSSGIIQSCCQGVYGVGSTSQETDERAGIRYVISMYLPMFKMLELIK